MSGSLAIIGLGTNLGDREANLDQAITALQAMPHVRVWTVSDYYETAPVGGPPGQGPFLNAAVLAEPVLDPLSLLELLHRVEAKFGRERTERWGPRTIDLDLLLYGEEVRQSPEITLPHPRLAFRRFALVPAAEVAPWSIDPLTGLTVNEMLNNLDRRPSLVAIAAADPADQEAVELAAAVHPMLVEKLGGEALKRSDLLGTSPTDAPAHPRDRLHAEIQAIARRCPASRWSDADQRDRWLVADFSLDLELRRAEAMNPNNESTDGGRWKTLWNQLTHQRAAAVSAQRAVEPTFVVLLGRAAPEIRNQGFRRPILIPEATDPPGIVAEVVLACESARE